MRGRWKAIHDDLMRSVSTQAAEREFKENRSESLRRFESPLALVGYLTSKAGDPSEKNGIYFDLVTAVQGHCDWTELAMSILWLGLWPALDAIYRRKLRFFARSPDELVSALCEHFAAAIGSADLEKIHRIASTLTMNAERRLVDDLRKRWRVEARHADLPEDDRLARQREVVPALLEGRPGSQEIAALRARLLPLVGSDVELVLAVVLGESQREAGERLGLTHDVARKRYQRALDRIRDSEAVVVPFRPQNLRL
jgi:DNA-directed RNA polymerase specialized sigma24 family protein